MYVTMKNNWTNIQIFLIYQQLLALIIIYLMSLHSIEFVQTLISLVSVSFWLVSVLFFLGHPVHRLEYINDAKPATTRTLLKILHGG